MKVVRYSKVILMALILITGLVFPKSAYAIADPDTPPAINAVYVYEDLIEEGDCGVLIAYFLDYAVPPTETATEAFFTVFVDTDGTSQLKGVSPYAYDDDGYGYGVTWIYFTAQEVVDYSITSASENLYRVWFVGNPTLSWTGDPPKTVATIDYWMPAGASAATNLGLRVLYYAAALEAIWSIDLIETTTVGNRLTTLGEAYFINVIPDLREIAPNVFSAADYDPEYPDVDYSTEFGAVVTGSEVAGSPVTCVSGANNITINDAGTVTMTLEAGTYGTVAGGIIVEGTPLDIVPGVNTITTSGAGAITVTVALETTQTGITDTVTGTGLDLADVAAAFGMNTMLFSGGIWLIVSIIICAGVYQRAGSKVVLLVFNLCIIGGAVLGLVSILVAGLMFICSGAFTAYIIFFKGANA